MILLLDNYDSFVHNLARYCNLTGMKTKIIRNDSIDIKTIKALDPEAILISPGPCTPKEAGISTQLIRELGAHTPILGICLGHQCIAEAYGGTIKRTTPMHGKSSTISHDERGLFAGLPNPLTVGRYHSLITDLPEQKDNALTVQSRTDKGEIMAMSHKTHPVYGVQFHPESILTEHGLGLIRNFITLAKDWNKQKRQYK